MGSGAKIKSKAVFITGTDTDVGKTVVTFVVGALLQKRGCDVGVMKPVQCSGEDAAFLRKNLNVTDSLQDINPYYAEEPLSPHLAFQRQHIHFKKEKIFAAYRRLQERHDFLIVEGAGGVLVPITPKYLMIDLIKDLDLDVVIVARLGLGTINHTLLTINQIKRYGLNVRGVIFNETEQISKGVAEQTNPQAVKKIGQVPVLGVVPYLKEISQKEIEKKCVGIAISQILNEKERSGNPSSALKRWDKDYLWHPFTQMQDWLQEDPIVIERGEGNYLIDSDGKKYLDGISSLWVNVHGHNHPQINQAIKNQVDKISHSTLLGLSNVPAIQLAKKLVEITPSGLDKVFYSDNGSTAVEIAIKMAYQYWQNAGQIKKTDIVHLANSYHGDTLGSVSVGGIELFHQVYRKLIFKTIQLDFPDCYRAPKGKVYPDYAFECLERFEQILKTKHHSIACLVLEPIVQGAAGMIIWPDGVLKGMAQLCRQYDVLLIADEVATGFGRTGKMFACEHEKVIPDIMCLAKGITGGYLPLAATMVSQRIFDGFVFDYKDQKTFFHGHTYTGNPLACAAALANIDIFKNDRTLEKLQSKIKHLSQQLPMFYNLNFVGDVRQKGFMVGIELVKDKVTKEPFPWQEKMGVRVCQAARAQGVMLRPLGNVIVLMPSLSISVKEIDQLIGVTYQAIKQVTEDD